MPERSQLTDVVKMVAGELGTMRKNTKEGIAQMLQDMQDQAAAAAAGPGQGGPMGGMGGPQGGGDPLAGMMPPQNGNQAGGGVQELNNALTPNVFNPDRRGTQLAG